MSSSNARDLADANAPRLRYQLVKVRLAMLTGLTLGIWPLSNQAYAIGSFVLPPPAHCQSRTPDITPQRWALLAPSWRAAQKCRHGRARFLRKFLREA
jgi:hypothetical protein